MAETKCPKRLPSPGSTSSNDDSRLAITAAGAVTVTGLAPHGARDDNAAWSRFFALWVSLQRSSSRLDSSLAQSRGKRPPLRSRPTRRAGNAPAARAAIVKAIAKVAGERGAIEMIDVPFPVRGRGEAIVRITGAGICGTDVSIWLWRAAIAKAYSPTFPVIVGHEFAGVVEDCDRGDQIARGDLVVVNPQLACGDCFYCALGEQPQCDRRRLMGGHIDGGWVEYVAAPLRNLIKVPAHVDPAVVPLIEPLSVAVHSVCQRVIPRQGDLVVVMGAGPIGLMNAILAKAAGASAVLVSGLSRDRERLQLATDLGMLAVMVGSEDLLDAVQRFAVRGADVVYECTGSPAGLAEAARVVRKAGRVALMGLPGTPSTVETTPLVMRQVELIGTRGYNDSTWPLTIRLLDRIGGDARKLVTHELSLRDYARALELVESGRATKVILRPQFEG
jgi:threonine dehydrogenase-like Zn-dependent dehydrogenase